MAKVTNQGAASAGITPLATIPTQPTVNKNVITEIENDFAAAYDQLEVAAAIIDAVGVLCALERAPSHHDTHPSSNIITGGGYAHGRRCFAGTLPMLMNHAHCLVSAAMNDFDVIREYAIAALREGGEV